MPGSQTAVETQKILCFNGEIQHEGKEVKVLGLKFIPPLSTEDLRTLPSEGALLKPDGTTAKDLLSEMNFRRTSFGYTEAPKAKDYRDKDFYRYAQKIAEILKNRNLDVSNLDI